MPSIVLYLLKCQICLAIVWLFYQLLLRRLTFYAMNRWYLLGYACLSFLLPLVHIVLPEEGTVTGKGQMISYIPVIIGRPAAGAENAAFTGWQILLFVLALGALLLAGRLLIRCVSLRRIRKEAIRQLADLPAALVRDRDVTVYQVDKPIIPFSFGNAIYINTRLHTEKELHEIVLHEYVHVRQRHTVDILLAELLCIVSWYNPFSWLIRHAVRQNLEFIADQQVLASGLDRKSYQYHLLKVVGDPVYRLANNFNFSSLKKRIVMMNKSKSARLHLVKFLFIVPLLGVLLVAFRDKVSLHVQISKQAEVNLTPAVADTMPPPVKVVSALKLKGAEPMMVLDEEESTKEKVDKVDPNDIATVSVLKQAPEFGPRGVNGVVLVYRKNYVLTGIITLSDGKKVKLEQRVPKAVNDAGDKKKEVVIMDHPRQTTGDASRDTQKVNLTVKDEPKLDINDCLFILDGRASSYDEVSKLPPAKIASINILKDKSAVAIYGPRAKNGVIMVDTKGLGFKGQPTITSIEKGDTVIARADTIRMIPRENEN